MKNPVQKQMGINAIADQCIIIIDSKQILLIEKIDFAYLELSNESVRPSKY